MYLEPHPSSSNCAASPLQATEGTQAAFAVFALASLSSQPVVWTVLPGKGGEHQFGSSMQSGLVFQLSDIGWVPVIELVLRSAAAFNGSRR